MVKVVGDLLLSLHKTSHVISHRIISHNIVSHRIIAYRIIYLVRAHFLFEGMGISSCTAVVAAMVKVVGDLLLPRHKTSHVPGGMMFL